MGTAFRDEFNLPDVESKQGLDLLDAKFGGQGAGISQQIKKGNVLFAFPIVDLMSQSDLIQAYKALQGEAKTYTTGDGQKISMATSTRNGASSASSSTAGVCRVTACRSFRAAVSWAS